MRRFCMVLTSFTKNMRYYLLLFTLLLPVFTRAQTDLLANTDIVWAAEIEHDWKVEFVKVWDEQDADVVTLKLLRTPQNASDWYFPYLAHLVFDAAVDKKLPIFRDAECTIPVEAYEAYPGPGMDTIMSFDPETYEERAQIVWKEPNIEGDFVGWRLRQILYYNAKKAVWGTKIVAVAPLMRSSKRDTASPLRPIFWLKANEKPQQLSSDDIVWAKQVTRKQAVAAMPDNILQRGTEIIHPVADLWRQIKNNPDLTLYDTSNKQPLTAAERRQMTRVGVDTVVTFNPETYEEKVKIRHYELKPDDMDQLRLIQHWYWDERCSQLSVTLEAVGVLIKTFDDKGAYQYSRLLFYRRGG